MPEDSPLYPPSPPDEDSSSTPTLLATQATPTDGKDKTLHQLALNAQKEENYDSACIIWRGILARQPEDMIAANNLAVLLRKMGRLAESEAILRQSIQQHPTSWTLFYTLGTTLVAWNNEEEALHAYVTALELAPEEASIHYAIASLLLKQNQPLDALFHFRQTIRQAPQHASAHVGAARSLLMLEEHAEAELLLIRATELDPFNAPAHYFLANLWLLQQNARRGWLQYEWRFKTGVQLFPPPLDIWQGEPLRSRTLLIVAEQGTAATIFFVRFLKFLPKKQIILKCKDELIPLLRSGGFVEHLWPKSLDDPPDDTPTPQCWCSLGSLPLLINHYQDPSLFAVPYLRADPTEVPIWQRQFHDQPTIGIAWKSSPPLLQTQERGFPLQHYQPLLSLPHIRLVALHPDISQEEKLWLQQHRITTLERHFDSDGGFVDTASLMEALSLVISPGGAFAHLAGALARPVFVLSPPHTEWMWKNHQGEAFWYPSAEIFSYDHSQSEIHAIEKMVLRLKQLQQG